MTRILAALLRLLTLCSNAVLSLCGHDPALQHPGQSHPTGPPFHARLPGPKPPALPSAAAAAADPLRATRIGRFEPDTDGHLRFGWPGSAVGARFVGSNVSVVLSDYQPMQVDGAAATNSFDVHVDGGPATAITLHASDEIYPLAQDLPFGEHTVWVRKRTEGLVGSAHFGGFVPGPGGILLPPPEPRARRIEAIGASNETGYGVLAAVTALNMCHYSPATQNAELAYPRLLADAVDAELVTIAFHGKGLYQNAYPELDGVTLPQLYDRVDPLDDQNVWRFGDAAPHLVLVDLGGNDFLTGTPPRDGFVRAYTGLLNRVRGQYPQAEILCLMGPTMMGEARTLLQEFIGAAVAERVARGDAKVAFFAFPLYHGKIFGCDFHPSAAMHQQMALALRDVVRARLNW